jgi:diguanylate cyclase (GGDEF)-like protein
MQLIAEPPSRQQVLVAIAVAVVIGTITVAILPFADTFGPDYPRLMLGGGIAEVMGYLGISILLLSEAAILENAGRAVLGAAYLFAASMFIPAVALIHEPFQLRGIAQGTWILLFLDIGFALLVLLYALRAHDESEASPSIARHIIGALMLAAASCGSTWLLLTLLPPQSGGSGLVVTIIVVWLDLLLNAVALVVAAVRLRARTPADLWLLLVLLTNCIEVVLTVLGHDRFTYGWYLARFISLGGTFALLLPVSTEITALFRRLAEANRMLDRMAYADTLTDLPNRRQFDLTLLEEYRRARRTGAPLAMIMLDIDRFKQLNDQHGHPAGDECLQRVAAVLSDTARRTGDIAARIGGEEFAVLLAATDLPQAMYVAEQIRSGVKALNIPYTGNDSGAVTVSAGVAVLLAESGRDHRWLVGAADRALYKAKSGGGDGVVMAAETEDFGRAVQMSER